MKNTRRFALGVLLSAVLLMVAGVGCSSPDTENRSERPWNAPKSWEHGVPSQIMDGRY